MVKKHYSLYFRLATLRPLSQTLDLPRALLPELHRYKGTVRYAELDGEVPGHC